MGPETKCVPARHRLGTIPKIDTAISALVVLRMISSSRRFAILSAVLLLIAVHITAQSATGETARRIIHIDSYQPTPGDVYTLAINYGINVNTGASAQTEYVQLILAGDYTLEVPYIGPVNVRTLSYDELRSEITRRVRERSFAQFVSLNLTAPAVFDVLIWGGVQNPGYHTVSSLARLSDTLAVAGGRVDAGTLRKVELTRGDSTTVHDLVSYAARGSDGENPFIRPGDRIRVPLAELAVDLNGAVARPGPIEALDGETVGDLIELAGGLLPTAQLDEAVVTRIGADNRYAILDLDDVDLTTLPARPGDVVTIPSSTTTTELVQIEGAIYTSPAEEGSPRSVPTQPILLEVPYTPGLTVLGLLERFGGPTPFAETERSFIIRAGSGERSPIPDLGELWESRQWDRDIALSPGDRLVIPMMRLVVSVGGQVNSPGGFTFTSGYNVGDYLELAGGIVEQDGSRNRIFFAESDGTRTRVDLETAVSPGTNIYVARSGWAESKLFFSNFFTVTGWITGIVGVGTVVVEFIQLFIPGWPNPAN